MQVAMLCIPSHLSNLPISLQPAIQMSTLEKLSKEIHFPHVPSQTLMHMNHRCFGWFQEIFGANKNKKVIRPTSFYVFSNTWDSPLQKIVHENATNGDE